MTITEWLRKHTTNRRAAWGEAGLAGCRFDEAADLLDRYRITLQAARKHIDPVVQYRLVDEIDALLKIEQ